jgi:hypothetical protein
MEKPKRVFYPPRILKGKFCKDCALCSRLPTGGYECWGTPPVPVLVSVQADQFGRLAMHMELMRPAFEADHPACGQYSPRQGEAEAVPEGPDEVKLGLGGLILPARSN